MLERLFHLRPAEWTLPFGITAVAAALFLMGPQATEALRYDRAAILAGEVWRLVTGHLVHADAPHLAWNVAGVLLVWFLFAREYSLRGWLGILLASTVATDLGFLLLEPGLDWYVGFSGVLHGGMAAGLVAWLRTARDPLTLVVGVLFAAKLLWEHVAGPLPFTASSMSLPVIYEAHSYGAVGGTVAGLWLTARRPRAGRSV